MNKIIFILATGLMMGACNQEEKNEKPASQIASSTEPVSESLTTIKWMDSTFQNLGKITKGQVVEVTFKFRNTGDKPLIISEARPGCGCTVTNPPTEPIAPNGEETIRAKFDSKNQGVGSHTKNITVTANTKPEQTHILTFSVEVIE